jgi:hypothetical protein
MKMLQVLLAIAVSCVAAACVPHSLSLGPAAGAGPVTCDTNCKAVWERAQYWVATHAGMKIQTVTDVLIQTYNPGEDPSYGFIVTKQPLDGSYRIVIQSMCQSLFGCGTKSADVESAFYYYVATGKDVLEGVSARGLR